MAGGSAFCQTGYICQMSGATKPVAVVCVACDAPTSSTPSGWLMDWESQVANSLIKCSHCGHLIVIRQRLDFDYKGDLTDDGPPTVIWPTLDVSLSPTIPDAPRKAHEEARACYRAGQYTASALMVRRTLEAVCADKGATGRDLQKKLDSLKTTGVIEGRLTEWSHDLRALGNEAAHDTSVFISSDDARDALDLSEALLSYVYVFSQKYQAFRGRRSSLASAPPTTVSSDTASAIASGKSGYNGGGESPPPA